ncbi:exocyst complex subunit SEC6 [Tubulinosema ratisbonensis]|uniref:Exocyst complex subunit SEC6 n=1 Tax=Tubulinosema ratisbonensis TaxID=291195 RepID=A0A437AL15_9MICR|nr:exocyst complex subunit SEC6 [Tubulinosema ratisbonensis]
MDEALRKINSEEKLDPTELKKKINELHTNYHTLTNKIVKIQNHSPCLINHYKLTTILPEQTLLLSTAYKNLLFVYNAHLRLKNIKKEVKEIYPLEIKEIKEKFIKFEELNEFKKELKNYSKLECVNKLGLDLELKIINFNLFEENEFIKQIDFICKKREDWRNKLVKETKNKISKRINDYDTVLSDFSKMAELKNEIIDKKELIDFYFDNLKESVRNKVKETDISKLLSLFEFEYELKLINDSNFIYLPNLLENKNLLVEKKYVNFSKEKIEEWMRNVNNSILNARNQPCPLDEHNKFICTYFITLLDLIRNQIEPVKFSKEIREKIENVIVEGVKNMVESVIDQLQSEFSSAVNLKSPPGYEEYVIMISNSSLKLAQFANDSLESKILSEIFVELMNSCNSLLSNFIIYTCKPILNLIFTDKWYEREKNIIPTVNDFLSDYKNRMNEYNFYNLGINLSIKLTDFYFSQIKRNRAKLYEDAKYHLKKDYLEIEELFYKYKLDIKMEKLRILKDLLENEGEAFFTEVCAVKDRIPKETVLFIVRKRECFKDKEIGLKKVKDFYGESKKEKGIFEKFFG